MEICSEVDVAQRHRQVAEGVWAWKRSPGTQTRGGGFLNTKCAVLFSHGEKKPAVRNHHGKKRNYRKKILQRKSTFFSR